MLPLLLSPVLVILAALLYLLLRYLRLRFGITKEWCICVGEKVRLVAIPQPVSVMALQMASTPMLEVSTGERVECSERYAGSFLGLKSQGVMDAAHLVRAGVVSFARGLNDTPKIAALLLVIQALDVRMGMGAISLTMSVGGLLSASKVAETMSHRITSMKHGQGLAANLATGILVILASLYGLPA